MYLLLLRDVESSSTAGYHQEQIASLTCVNILIVHAIEDRQEPCATIGQIDFNDDWSKCFMYEPMTWRYFSIHR
jgi:hypothetical protein